MISLEDIHNEKQNLFEKIGLGRWCDWLEEKTFIRPNHITGVNVIIGIGAVVSLFNDRWLTTFLIVLMLFIDGFDGYYASRNILKSKLGELLDHGGDFVIGVAMLLKSYFYFVYWWIIFELVLFVGEAILIWVKGWGKIKFPERDFIYLFIFGWYVPGLVLQLVLQPIILGVFLVNRFRGVKINN